MEHLDPKYRRWLHIVERGALILVLLIAGASLGYMAGIQGSDSRVAAADKRLVDERTDRLEEIKRLQESYGIALQAATRASERVARQAIKAAEKAESVVEKAESTAEKADQAASTARSAAARANRVAPVAAPAVNERVREANKRLRDGK